jgi:GntR family transcriptional regulator/MocR family aminotransferase
MTRLSSTHLCSLVDLDRSSSTPLYQQLCGDLRRAITDGTLAPGTRLPSTRALTGPLDISRNTAASAFNQLRSEGYLHRRVGSGTYVADDLPEQHTQVESPEAEFSPAPGRPDTRGRPALSDGAQAAMREAPTMMRDPTTQAAFRPGVPALDAFPIETWSTLASRRWRSLPAEQLVYGDPAGYPPLRDTLAAYLRTARGVRCDAEQVLIVGGVQQACTLAARVLLNPGDAVYVEDPGFPRIRMAYESVGARSVPVPVDEDGLDLSAAPEGPVPRMASITPSHQYPLGMTMTLSRRRELLEWAVENDVWILEDDYDSEFRYSGQPIAALQGFRNAGRVLYTGTFSKVLFPALRLGYLVVPPDLVKPFAKMRALSDRCPPRVAQMILTDFITEGYFEQHIRQMRTLYAARQRALLDAIDTHLADFIDIRPDDAGLHLVGWLPDGVDDREVSAHLDEHDIVALPLSFYSERPLERGGLLLGYAGVPEEEIGDEVRRMAEILTPFRT